MDWLEIGLSIVILTAAAALYPFLGWLALRWNSRSSDALEARWDRAAAAIDGVHIAHSADGYRLIRWESSGVPLDVGVKYVVVNAISSVPFLRVRLPIPSLASSVISDGKQLHVEGSGLPSVMFQVLEKDLAGRRPADITLSARDGQLTVQLRNENLTPTRLREWVERASRWASPGGSEIGQ